MRPGSSFELRISCKCHGKRSEEEEEKRGQQRSGRAGEMSRREQRALCWTLRERRKGDLLTDPRVCLLWRSTTGTGGMVYTYVHDIIRMSRRLHCICREAYIYNNNRMSRLQAGIRFIAFNFLVSFRPFLLGRSGGDVIFIHKRVRAYPLLCI